MNDGKNKLRPKKPSILRGIGHMFRFGKHRKDSIVPSESQIDGNNGSWTQISQQSMPSPPQQQQSQGQGKTQALSKDNSSKIPIAATNSNIISQPIYATAHRPINGHHPPKYQPPPPPQHQQQQQQQQQTQIIDDIINRGPALGGGIHQNDLFNQRYSHYVNYDELQQQLR